MYVGPGSGGAIRRGFGVGLVQGVSVRRAGHAVQIRYVMLTAKPQPLFQALFLLGPVGGRIGHRRSRPWFGGGLAGPPWSFAGRSSDASNVRWGPCTSDQGPGRDSSLG